MSKFKVLGLFLVIVASILFFLGNSKYHIIAFNIGGDSEHLVRVLTWNICSANIDNLGEQDSIARLVIAQDADFVQLNEFTLDSCLVIDSLLSEYYPYKVDVNAKIKAGDVFYSKVQLAESGKIDKVIPNGIYSKMCIGSDSLYVLGCHLPGNNHEGQIEIDDTDSLRRVKTFWGRYRNAQEKRKASASFLKKTIRESSLPIIVMGDMNDFNASAPMDSLRDVGMKNAWWEGGFGYGVTYHEGWLRLRIDHIYYNEKLELKDVRVVKTGLSDHNILIADFSIAN
jgi:hypothetical protein